MNKALVLCLIALINMLALPVDGAVDPPRAGNADGNPAFLQSRFGSQGNFELAVPAAGTGILYYWRDNDHNMTWNGPSRIFAASGAVDAVSMFQSNYGTPGNFEMVLRRGQALAFAFRVDRNPWQGPFALSEPTDQAYFAEGPPLLRRGYTEYLGSFSNNPIQHQQAVGIVGTDLGVGFEAAAGARRLTISIRRKSCTAPAAVGGCGRVQHATVSTLTGRRHA